MSGKLTATYLYHGMSDYWSGNGQRWDDNAGCLFAHYGPNTTLREIVDGLCEDFLSGGDCDSMPESVTEDMVKQAILDSLTDQGRKDYEHNIRAKCAEQYAEVNDYEQDENGEYIESDDDTGESPMIVFLLEYENE